MATDANAMAKAIQPPSVVLPRGSGVPLIGRWLARVLPPKVFTGRVLSYAEFMPFQDRFADALAVDCVTCGEELMRCRCPDDKRAPVPRYDEKEFEPLCIEFLRAQGLPAAKVFRLPGVVLNEVMRELFLIQTRANLPRPRSQTSGSASPPRDSVAEMPMAAEGVRATS